MRIIHFLPATLLFILSTFCQNITAQCTEEKLFPGISGTALYEKVVEEYTPHFNSNYSEARDIMYAVVDNHNDTVECVYTGFQIYIDPDLDPSDAAFTQGINTEHVYPRSKGAEQGIARYDMHHLMPTREEVNARRSNNPFYNIDDPSTEFWYRLDKTRTNVPAEFIDEYSEATQYKFEPKEDTKGDIARAVFYFYTIYRDEANREDENFFPLMRKTLLQWHSEDTISDREYDRSHKIGLYQDNTPNPFVEDCTLAQRLYCYEFSEYCDFVISTDEIAESTINAEVSYNQSNREILLEVASQDPGILHTTIYSMTGKNMHSQRYELHAESQIFSVDMAHIESGIYLIYMQYEDLRGNIYALPVDKMFLY